MSNKTTNLIYYRRIFVIAIIKSLEKLHEEGFEIANFVLLMLRFHSIHGQGEQGRQGI